MKVRAFYRSIAVEGFESPYNILSLKVFYPAKFDESEEVMNMGIVPVDKTLSPFPVVLFISGVNVSVASYQWLGIEMAKNGIIFVTFDWVTNSIPGGKVGLTPGVDLEAMTPEIYGTKPSGSAISTLLRELENIQNDSLLKGLLDLDKVILGGHSAGGSIAIMNANPNFFPNIIGGFSYGSHSQGATMLGFPPDTFLPISSEIPIFIAGGTKDGVIASSVKRYGKKDSNCVIPLVKTYEENLTAKTKRLLAIFENANHFLATHPIDETTGRSYLDSEIPTNNESLRKAFSSLTLQFIKSACLNTDTNKSLTELIKDIEQKGLLSEVKISVGW
jgi:hypothetical protein